MTEKTINKVHKLDYKWTKEYAESEEDLDSVVALIKQLKESSTRGGETSPLYFNSTTYKNSEVFKNVEVRKKENEEYLKVKKEEAEKRLMKDLKAQLDSVTNPDEYLKIANKIGFENLEPSQQQYALQLEKSRQTIEIAKGVGVGLYDAGKDFVGGAWDFVTNPEESLEGMANSISHPVQTYKYISKSIKDSYERDMVNGDAYSRAHWVSYALGTAATSVVGTKGAGSITKTGVATTKTAAVKGTVKAKELSGSIANLLPYNPRNHLELTGGVPYNAVNGAGLKDSLISQAQKIPDSTRKPFTGKNISLPWLNEEKYNAVEVQGKVKVKGKIKDIDRRVYQIKDLDINKVDPGSKQTNLQIMKEGNSPYANDGTQINLHHIIQEEPGAMLEIPESLHKKYTKVIHGLKNNGESFRQNPELVSQYNSFRKRYWKWRAKQYETQE